MSYKLLLGRRYNRAKKAEGGRADRHFGADKLPAPKTAEKLAKEHGVDEKTVRRAGQFQAAAAKLGIEKDIAAGKVKATEAASRCQREDCCSVTPSSASEASAETTDTLSGVFGGLPPFSFSMAANISPALRSARFLRA